MWTATTSNILFSMSLALGDDCEISSSGQPTGRCVITYFSLYSVYVQCEVFATLTLFAFDSWEGICCNEALSQIDIKGVGRDIYWPPQVPTRNYTVESIVGPRHLSAGGCSAQYVSLTA